MNRPASVPAMREPERLLMMSPGKPYLLADVAYLEQLHESNPWIAEVFYQTDHIERMGTGHSGTIGWTMLEKSNS